MEIMLWKHPLVHQLGEMLLSNKGQELLIKIWEPGLNPDNLWTVSIDKCISFLWKNSSFLCEKLFSICVCFFIIGYIVESLEISCLWCTSLPRLKCPLLHLPCHVDNSLFAPYSIKRVAFMLALAPLTHHEEPDHRVS
jgi:hypothetical protein